MNGDFILSQMKRCNKNLLLANLLILITVVLILSFSYNYFYNILLGPFEMDSASVTAIRGLEAQKKDYITVKGADVAHTGLQIIETTYEEGTNKVANTKVISDYIYLLVQDRLLVIKAAPGATDLSYAGMIKEIPADIRQELINAAEQDDISAGEFNQIVLPFMLDTQVSRAGGYIGLITLVLLFLLSAWNLLKYGQRVSDPFGHPIYKKLRSYGEPESVAKNIDEDITGSGIPLSKNIIVSNGWLVQKKFFGLTLVSLQEVLWMYKHITKQSINFIPVGKTYSLKLHLKNRTVLHFNMKEKYVDAMAEVVHSKAPDIVNGYSDELAALWNRSYPAFVAEIQNLKSAVYTYNPFPR